MTRVLRVPFLLAKNYIAYRSRVGAGVAQAAPVTRAAPRLLALVRLQRSPHDPACSKGISELFDSTPIYAEVRIPDARCRTNRHQVARRAEMKLEIVDEAKQSAFTLGMEIICSLVHYGGAGQIRHLFQDDAPGVVGRSGQGEGFDPMGRVGCIARHAIRGRRARRQPGSRDPEIGRTLPAARKDRHDGEEPNRDYRAFPDTRSPVAA
jgi:hypothetical protein